MEVYRVGVKVDSFGDPHYELDVVAEKIEKQHYKSYSLGRSEYLHFYFRDKEHAEQFQQKSITFGYCNLFFRRIQENGLFEEIILRDLMRK